MKTRAPWRRGKRPQLFSGSCDAGAGGALLIDEGAKPVESPGMWGTPIIILVVVVLLVAVVILLAFRRKRKA